ncbi:interaptin [Legionella hackeliae]|uniref:hypothetical protein n=1 Tax=Legionella hackeliae TaxID=449 RepID=UPI000E188696|nr:hypothetical protein [Legionella hackeliae]STX48726.1 interaptin [Legionella hackeliae]
MYNSDFNTVFEANDPTSDDWALTAMTFGICNLEAYFALVKGRAVADYVIPGILALEGLPPHEKLVIIDDKKFTEFFACRNPSDSSAFNTGVVATHPTPVMFIPSNQREGEPLHLFRRLQELQRSLASDKDVDESKTKIAREIETILSTVYNAIASGKGLNKQELTKQLDAAQRCLQNYEKIKDTNYQEGLLKQEVLHSLLKAIHERPVSADDLLKSFPEDGPSQLKILCTYPSSVEQKKQVVEIFQKTFSESAFVDKFIGEKAPARDLFKDMIARHQTEILISLLAKIPENKNEDFIKIVSEDGLLHYAAEQGLTKVFGSLVDALTRAGATPTAILDLSLIEYKSGPKQAHNASHLRWSTSCFHIAIRNNNPKLLARLLTLLPDENNDKNIIDEALHFCAVLGNKQLFQQIEKARLHATSPVTAARIMGIKLPPEYLSPYHLFLNNEATLAAIKWKTLTNQPELGKQFLLSSDGNPLLIAAAKANFAGVFQLLELGKAIDFEDWTKVLSETDANGKNLLNYMLELNQLEHLSRFINFIKETTENSNDILVQLLSNPHPVNPLKNFLSQQTNSDQHFVVVKMLLDTICSNFATATIEQQQARVVALLINKDWLIEQAKDTKNFEELNKLLQNEALSIPFKQSLFKTLKEASQDNVARTFYEKLLTEVSRIPVEIDKKTQLEISGVFAEVIRQSSDFEELFKALTEEHKVASEFERDARDLKEKVQKYAEKEQRLESTLKQQQVEATELKETLHQTKDQLEKASVLTLKLQQKSEKATKDYLAKETLLKQEIEKEKSSVAAVEEELREAKEQHQQEQERLVCALKEVESHINVLKQELEEKSSELDSKGKSYRQLEAQYKELEENKNSLVEELKHSKSVEKETQEKLLAEIKTREGKESDLQELGKQLDALRDEKTKLGQELESLQTLNKRLGEENSELQQRVKEYKENSETLDRELKKYLSEVVTLKEGLQETQEKLQEASARTSQLEEEIKTKQDEYDRQEASLKEEIEETKKTSESGIKAAEEKLRQAKEQHQQEQERLVCALKEVESHINVLKQELEEKSSELDSKGKSYRQLEAQYKELEENKNSLVEELKHSKSVEKETQEKLLAEIKTREGKESDLQELGKQLDALRDEKTKLGQELESLQTLNKRLGEENSELQQRVKEYKENSETLDRELKKYLSEVVTLKEGLQETQEKLQEASARTSQLEQEIENTTTAFLEKEILLKKQIEETKQSAERDVAGVKQKLAEAEKSYQVTLNSLSVSLKEVTEEVQQLQSSLQEKDLQFKVKEESYKKLETESAELKQLKEKLQKELSDSKRLSESTISELQMKLDVETKAGVDKQAKLQELSQQLGNLQATLKSQTEELQTKNGELEDVKRFLESEHIRFSQELETIKKQIEEERYKAQEAETKQKQAEKSAEEAQLETRRILEEMKRLRKEMEIQEAKVKAREQRVAEREQQVEERAAEVEALHQEVLRVEEDVHRREDELAHAEIPIENPRELARRKAITALKAKFARSIDDDLLTAISHATSNEDLAKLGLDLKYLAVLEHDDYLLIADATDERLTQLQEERSEIKTELLERNYKAVLGENREKLRRIYNNLNKIDTLDKGITNELNYLVQISPLHWFSPAFQASLKKNAHELAPHYERLAEGCNVVVDYLKPLSIELKHQFRSLPSIEEIEHLPENSPKRSDIESRRALLTRYLQRVQGQLDLYEPLYKLLNGDPAASNPLLRQGIRKTLKYAQDEKYSLKFSSFSSDYRDYSQEERALHLQAGYESNVEGNVTEISSNTGLAHYQVVESAKQNYFREHIINPDDQFCGYFIEDRAKNLDSPLYGDSLKGYRPSITITVSKFPQGPDSRDPQLIAARVQYALAVATHLLSEFVEPPTAKDPVIMRGPNPEELRYLWTAMVLVGKEVSGFQFPPEAVAVASAVFKPGLEMEKTGFWGGWTTQWRANSCYETSFRGQPSVDIWLTGLKEASRHRANFKGESDRIKKLVGDVTQTFFGNAKAKTVVEDLKQEVLKNGPNAGG